MLPRAKLFKCTGPFLSSGCPNGKVSGRRPCNCSSWLHSGANGLAELGPVDASVLTCCQHGPPIMQVPAISASALHQVHIWCGAAPWGVRPHGVPGWHWLV